MPAVAIAKSIERNKRRREDRADNADVHCHRANAKIPKKVARERHYRKKKICTEECKSACVPG